MSDDLLAQANNTPIKWDSVSVRVDKWKRLQTLCEELEPHEHYEGMNECHICDEPLTDVLIRHLESIAALKAENAALRKGAERGKWMLNNCEWLRRESDGRDPAYSMLCVRLPYEADQSCYAMRVAAIDEAMK